MSKTCNGCSTSNQPISVPYIVHESAMARAERQNKTLVWVIVLLIVLHIGWLVYESQFETVETVEEYAIEQNAESGNNNSIINGGEIINGKAEDNIQKNN